LTLLCIIRTGIKRTLWQSLRRIIALNLGLKRLPSGMGLGKFDDFNNRIAVVAITGSSPGLPPYMGYIGMCGPQGYGFSAVLVINRVPILAILVIKVFFCTLVLNWVFSLILLRRSYFFIIIDGTINKSPSHIMFTAI